MKPPVLVPNCLLHVVQEFLEVVDFVTFCICVLGACVLRKEILMIWKFAIGNLCLLKYFNCKNVVVYGTCSYQNKRACLHLRTFMIMHIQSMTDTHVPGNSNKFGVR